MTVSPNSASFIHILFPIRFLSTVEISCEIQEMQTNVEIVKLQLTEFNWNSQQRLNTRTIHTIMDDGILCGDKS